MANMKDIIKKIILRSYKLINLLPFNNRRRGKSILINDGAILWRCRMISHGEENHLILHKGVYIHCDFVFEGNNNTIEFGNGCVAKSASFYIEDDYNLIKSGNNTNYAGKIHIACTESTQCIVGNDCLFSSEIVIRTGDSHSILDKDGIRINQARDVIIGNHVWIGYRVLITKGVRIPENCVVGTGAILTKSVEQSNAIVAGVPAKVVKGSINWCGKKID